MCFHTGAPLILRILNHIGELQEITLGYETGHLQYTVRAGELFCAESLGQFSLLSCFVTPGFDFKDFYLMPREEFLMRYPQHHALSKLTRK